MASKEPKINPKLLNYDKTLPPFLARLQGAQGAGPSTYQSARPKKPRNPDDEAEDEPVYFDEGTNSTLTKAEWEQAEKEREEEDEKFGGGENGGKRPEDGDGGEKSKVEEKAVIGGSRKRKLGKVVGGGGGDDDHDDDHADKDAKKKDAVKNEGKAPAAIKGKVNPDAVKKGDKPKSKKSKKVKLSFGDDE